MLYLKSIRIKNIKKIKNLEYIFPEIKFDLDNKPIITKGILLTGSNFLGKTTFLQCLNTILKNDIGDNLKPDEALSKGQCEGGIDLKLIDENKVEHRIVQKYTRDTDKPVETSWVYQGAHNTIKSYQSGSLTKLKKVLNYHYINPNDIIALAQTAKGRRKLMNYFLNSVSDSVKKEYESWDTIEQEAFEIRTQKNTSYATCKTIEESLELTPEDRIELAKLDNLEATAVRLNSKRDDILKDIGSYNNVYNQLYFDPNVPETDRHWDDCVEGQIAYHEQSRVDKTNLLNQERQTLNTKVSENNELEGKFNPIIVALKDKLNTATIANYSDILDSIKAAYTQLSQLDTGVSNVITTLRNNIALKEDEISKIDNILEELDGKKTRLKSILPEIKPTTIEIDREIEENQLELDAINIIVDKNDRYNKAVTDTLNAKIEWEEYNDKVIEARDNKARIIKENNIEVEGFEFSPDGIQLKGFDFAERNISGAERRIAASQFTMAMNSVVRLTILEEMESLDEDQEQHILKFAADRGYIVISDNVIKQKVDDIIIQDVTIK